MPAKEIKELRQDGKIEEAYAMAKAELLNDPSNIWGKRNISWVLYAQLNENISNSELFLAKIQEVKDLDLPASEEMFFENLSIVIAKAANYIFYEANADINRLLILFDSIKSLPLKRNSKWFSVLFNSMHKGLKESDRYIEFADWWDFNNFSPDDFQKVKIEGGKEVMSIAEQGFITYAKHLLPKQSFGSEKIFNRERAEAFLPVLSQLMEQHPHFQYPAFFYAKLLIALDNKGNLLESFLPFARKKCNQFWVWEMLAEVFSSEEDKFFACYCRALSCDNPAEMMISVRQKMAKILIDKKHYNEAKTEIELLVNSRNEKGYKIPQEVINWQNSDWYKTASKSKSNNNFYKTYLPLANALLYNDIPEVPIIVEFVNTDKKMLNFIASENKFGFFKYERLMSEVKVGETLMVRFQGGSNEGMHQVYTAIKVNAEDLKKQFVREISGVVKIQEGKSFGFIDDVFIHPSLITKYQLKDGMQFTGTVIKSFHKEKKQWGWKFI